MIFQHAGNPFRDGLQRAVTGCVSEQIIDFLEPVEVEAQDGEPPPGRQRRCNFLVELVVEAAAIGEARQRVVVGKKENVLFRLLARAKVTNRDGAMRLSAQINEPLDDLDRHFFAVAMAQDAFDQHVLAIE